MTAVPPRYADPFTFVRACNDGVLPVILLGICIGCDVFEKYEDVVGQTRD
jgi:hypothetical protein